MIGNRLWRSTLLAVALTCLAIPATAKPTGAHPVQLERDPSLPYHTIYRPMKLTPKTPLVVFAGGGYPQRWQPVSRAAQRGRLAWLLGDCTRRDRRS